MGPITFATVWELLWYDVLQFVGGLLSSSIMVLMVTSSKRTHATHCTIQVCCSQGPWPCGRSVLSHASTRDAQKLKGRSGSVSRGGVPAPFPGSFCAQSFVCALWAFLGHLRFYSKRDFAPPTILLEHLLCLWTWIIFFWWDPTFSCWWLFSSELQSWCSRRRKWEHILLLRHLEIIYFVISLQ